MLNQYYNAEINILLCRCRLVSVSRDWRKNIFLPLDFWRLYYHPDSHVNIFLENKWKKNIFPPVTGNRNQAEAAEQNIDFSIVILIQHK